ncbi:MAG: hypothetical protein U0575_00180 [Phycisphaerales bacterium]
MRNRWSTSAARCSSSISVDTEANIHDVGPAIERLLTDDDLRRCAGCTPRFMRIRHPTPPRPSRMLLNC